MSVHMVDRCFTREAASWFRSVDVNFYDRADGSVEAPTGWFGLLFVDDAARESTEDQAPVSIQDGWYLVTIDSDGSGYAEQPISSAEGDPYALLVEYYTEKEEEFSRWSEQA